MHFDDRHGAKQPQRFDPKRAAALDDPARFSYLPPADVLALLDPSVGATVLDFGTGTGAYAIAIARVRPDLHLIALDEQPEMLELLRANLATERVPNVEPASSTDISALRSSVPRIMAINVFHELGDAVLHALLELLASNGRAVFVDWSAEVERPVGPPRDHVYTLTEARSHLEKKGFEIIAERRFPYHYALVAKRAHL